MEFVQHKTLNQLELNDENRDKIKTAINSYISSSFYALFNDLPIIFHGDPHNGNIYLDENRNVGFLDMGLLFELNESDTKLVKDFFFAAYTRNFEEMYTLITNYSKMDDKAKIKFKQDVKNYCDNLSNEPLTAYFVNIMNICLKYEVCPPDFLFCIAKSFICLGGINDFSKNDVSGSELLKAQAIEYFIRKNISANQNLMIRSIKLMPSFMEEIRKYGLVRGVSECIITNEDLKTDIKEVLTNYRELLEAISPSIQEIIYSGNDNKPKVNVINQKNNVV